MVVITLMMITMRVFMTIKLIMIWRIMVMVVVIIVPAYFASEEKKMVRWIFSKRKREDMRRGEKPELGLEFLSYAVFPFFAQWSYTAATHWIEFFKKSAHSTSTDCEVFSLSKSLYLVHCTCSWYLYLVLALGTLYLHLVLALGTCHQPPGVEADDGRAVLVHGVEERVDDVAHRATVPQQLLEPDHLFVQKYDFSWTN